MNDRNSCRYHPDALLIEDYHAGDIICSECGLVVGDRVIDVANEWRSFLSVGHETFSADPCRVGAAENALLAGVDLSTGIGPATGAAGVDEKGGAKYRYKRPVVRSADRVLTTAFRDISTMAERIHLPQTIVDRANNLFKKVLETKKVKGTHEAIASACLYLACKQEKGPRTLKEICAVSNVSVKIIGRCFKSIVRSLETTVEDVGSEAAKGADFMARFCGKLGLDMTVRRAAICIAERAAALDGVGGRSPLSIAGAALYLACLASGEIKSGREIGEVVGVSEGTIAKVYKLIYPKAAQMFPDSFVFAIPIAKLPAK